MKEDKITPAALNAALSGDIENFLTASTPGGIEQQEKQGQQDFVESTNLPRVCNGCTREELKKLGIIFGTEVDDLFISVQLPSGWKKIPTDHSMWSKLIDEKDRERASIFFKAAFYDRSAHISLERYITYSFSPKNGWDEPNYETSPWVGRVYGGGRLLHELKEHTFINNEDRWDAQDRELKKLKQWLKTNYPNHENPLVYWD